MSVGLGCVLLADHEPEIEEKKTRKREKNKNSKCGREPRTKQTGFVMRRRREERGKGKKTHWTRREASVRS
jgi:hypothetical protein